MVAAPIGQLLEAESGARADFTFKNAEVQHRLSHPHPHPPARLTLHAQSPS